MKTQLKNLLALIILSSAAITAKAQYPEIPDDVQRKSDSLLHAARKHSDSAWNYCMADHPGRSKKRKTLYSILQTAQLILPQSDIPAFPGAEGGGKYSFGGRGGKVIVVTNLNDDGPGSFRWACEQGGARIVVFNVAGIIRIKTPVIIRAPYITIAGQTAPGDGVCIAGESVWINTHDVIIRYMRFRRGETWVGRRDDAIGGNPIGNIMIDHVSATWGLG